MSGPAESEREPPGRLLADLASEVHLWLTPDPGSLPTARGARCLELLDPPERVQYQRFRVERARRLYLLARVLTRTALSRYVEVPPHAWRFRIERRGRPEIEAPAGLPPLRFNLSHTDGLVACAVALESDVGVDVEHTGRRVEHLDLADHSFSAVEAATLRELQGGDRIDRFFSYWTLKEAYIKARGLGMALPLRRFSFTFPGRGEIGVSFDPKLEDSSQDWQFELFRPSQKHLLAVAVRRRRGLGRRVVARRMEPPLEGVRRVALRRLAASAGSPGRG